MNVCCVRCGRTWTEDDERARYAYGDWRCTDETECDTRVWEARRG